MEKIEDQNTGTDPAMYRRWEQSHRRGKIFAGLLILAAGCLYLAREMGAFIPRWVFSWEIILIVIGLYVGIKHSFRNISWLIMILIGSVFLFSDYYNVYDYTHYLWPVILIIVGLYVIFRPHRSWHRHYRRKWQRYHGPYGQPPVQEMQSQASYSADDYIEVSAVFGSVKKNVISKTFKGGEVNSVFGGSEINLTQADFQGTIELELNSVFGGTRLIIPPHWEIKSKMEAVFGSVEDKRPVQKDSSGDGKVLVLKGSAVFGGIEIKSY